MRSGSRRVGVITRFSRRISNLKFGAELRSNHDMQAVPMTPTDFQETVWFPRETYPARQGQHVWQHR